jgi:hypothetical protein
VLTTKDERRVEILNRVLAGWVSAAEAAPLRGVSERQNAGACSRPHARKGLAGSFTATVVGARRGRWL